MLILLLNVNKKYRIVKTIGIKENIFRIKETSDLKNK
jgi:hypothetical protein